MDLIGRGGEIRTPDPLLPKQMRYQAALHPDGSFLVFFNFHVKSKTGNNGKWRLKEEQMPHQKSRRCLEGTNFNSIYKSNLNCTYRCVHLVREATLFK